VSTSLIDNYVEIGFIPWLHGSLDLPSNTPLQKKEKKKKEEKQE